MVDLAILLGIFSYAVLGLGLLGGLGRLGGVGVLGVLGIFIVIGRQFWKERSKLVGEFKLLKQDKISVLLITLIFASALVNLVGALGPELGFDALWYHLTIPKIYFENQKIFFIPGNLFYYNAMPKLTEMFYLASLVFSPSGTLAKLIHFLFGILSAFALYNLARRYLRTRESLLTVLIFYSSLIVGWQSITAYVDLARTFFEILALDLFLRWWEGAGKKDKKDKKLLIESAIMMGMAISTKLIAFATLPVFLILILAKGKKLLVAICYLLFVILVPLPWFFFSYIHTQNPFYPVFSGILDRTHELVSFNLIRFAGDFLNLLYRPADPITPVFLIFLPIVLLRLIKGQLRVEVKILLGYCFLTYLFWYFTPRTGGSRFILPFLPAWSLLLIMIVSEQKIFFRKAVLAACFFCAIVNIGYRAAANRKFLPVVLGRQSRQDFLEKNLNFSFGDFFDINSDLKNIIKKEDLVLIYGGHNLFYVDFPFVHSSYYKQNYPISYVIVQNSPLPEDFSVGQLLYQNQKTLTRLYLSKKPIK